MFLHIDMLKLLLNLKHHIVELLTYRIFFFDENNLRYEVMGNNFEVCYLIKY